VAAMIATSGDEAFVMLSVFPAQAVILNVILIIVGILTGYLTDRFISGEKLLSGVKIHEFEVHDADICTLSIHDRIGLSTGLISIRRALLIAILFLIFAAAVYDLILQNALNWPEVILAILSLLSIFVVFTVPEHFLKEHLWEHVVKKHISRIFLWTFGALIVVNFLTQNLELETLIYSNKVIILIIAILVGIIPESGPHMLFVALYDSGSIPFSILLANSIVQDGHGTLPLLSDSKKTFIILKLINVSAGFFIGILGIICFG
jgi:hypothetical protein